MTTTGRSIQIYLPSGEPRGVRIAEFTTRIVQAVALPRHRLDEAMQRPELGGVGVYFLVGQRDDEDDDRASVYIGEAEDCAIRLRQHNADNAKDFWQSAVVIVSRTQSFTKAHVRLLEYLGIQRARNAGRYRLENANAGIEPRVPEAMRSEVHEIFETMEVLISTLGFPVFDAIGVMRSPAHAQPVTPGRTPPAPIVQAPQDALAFRFRGDGYHAQLVYNDDGFVVLKDSMARLAVMPSGGEHVQAKRERLLREGVLIREPFGLRFDRDHAFKSPTAAAVLVCGASVNGWNAWTDDRGRTLDDVYRKATGP